MLVTACPGKSDTAQNPEETCNNILALALEKAPRGMCMSEWTCSHTEKAGGCLATSTSTSATGATKEATTGHITLDAGLTCSIKMIPCGDKTSGVAGVGSGSGTAPVSSGTSSNNPTPQNLKVAFESKTSTATGAVHAYVDNKPIEFTRDEAAESELASQQGGAWLVYQAQDFGKLFTTGGTVRFDYQFSDRMELPADGVQPPAVMPNRVAFAVNNGAWDIGYPLGPVSYPTIVVSAAQPEEATQPATGEGAGQAGKALGDPKDIPQSSVGRASWRRCWFKFNRETRLSAQPQSVRLR